MILDEFEKLLKQTMGLDAASIGISAIERAVQTRLTACQLQDMHVYWKRVTASKTELQELIEAVVVPETWFFRDREAFAALTRIVYEEWQPAHPRDTLSVLSLPCSTGEEPYSIAMALFDAGFPASRFRVDAVDISARALAFAKRAVYGKNSFRGDEISFRDRYFEATEQGYCVGESVRKQVCFQQGNLFDDGLLPGAQIYDVIFCRNVLIYFDRATQDRVIRVLTRLLNENGVLFVGPSETGLLLDHEFTSTKIPLTFAFRKARAKTKPHVATSNVSHSIKRVVTTVPAATRATVNAFAPAPSQPRSVTSTAAPRLDSAAAPTGSIDEAQRLADQGHLAEAARCCEQLIRDQGPSAQAFYLLGLTRDASGNHVEAAGFYRKAIYLDPNHREALLQLALLLENQGDAGAQALHQRARRLEPKGGK